MTITGTIASAAPFIGLAGTVVGILRAFNEMARKGAGGFTVVAAGISEALVATAAGIVVAVVAVIAFNALQTRWSQFVLLIKIQTEVRSQGANGNAHPYFQMWNRGKRSVTLNMKHPHAPDIFRRMVERGQIVDFIRRISP